MTVRSKERLIKKYGEKEGKVKGGRQKAQKVNVSNETDKDREAGEIKWVRDHKASGDNQRS